MPCNLVKMLQTGARGDNFRSKVNRGEELCQPVVWKTNSAMIPFRLLLPKEDKLQLNLYVECRDMTKATGSSRSAFSMSMLRPVVTRDTTCGRRQYTVHRHSRGATSRCASARCVLQGFVSETESIDEPTYKANCGG
eukprot:6213526-Pleurochrysis_carterae.AAC.1